MAARLVASALVALVANLMAFTAVRAEPCSHEGNRTSAVSPTPHPVRATVAEPAAHRGEARPATTLHAMRVGSHECCDGGGKPAQSCPRCPAGGTCAASGAPGAIVDALRAGTPSDARLPVPGATARRPASWSRSLDTPPPKR